MQSGGEAVERERTAAHTKRCDSAVGVELGPLVPRPFNHERVTASGVGPPDRNGDTGVKDPSAYAHSAPTECRYVLGCAALASGREQVWLWLSELFLAQPRGWRSAR